MIRSNGPIEYEIEEGAYSQGAQEGEMVSRVIPVSAFDLVLFGATGDLARRKIWPGLFHRFVAGQLDENSRILGVSRSDLERETFPERVG